MRPTANISGNVDSESSTTESSIICKLIILFMRFLRSLNKLCISSLSFSLTPSDHATVIAVNLCDYVSGQFEAYPHVGSSKNGDGSVSGRHRVGPGIQAIFC